MALGFAASSRSGTNGKPLPFLKWVGGKRRLLPELCARVDAAGAFSRYHEPFAGGAALFFELAGTRQIKSRAFLSDNNPRLIEIYCGVKDDLEAVIAALKGHERRHCKDYYYEVRSMRPRSASRRAARLIYLNRTCYNGVFRENSRGEFNTPVGRYKNPKICDEDGLLRASRALRKARVDARHFETVLQASKPGDLVYFDPPYHPISKTASFTSYNRNGFGEDSQRQLAAVFRELSERGVKAMLSNSMTPLVMELYRDFAIDEVKVGRSVNSRADRRGKISEALVRNF